MGRWVHDQQQNRAIVQVVQTGDAVESGYSPAQWQAVDDCLDAMGDMPYFAVAGNHEIGIRQKDYAAFLERPYIKALPENQKYLDGKAAYTRFSAGGVNMLIAGAGWGVEIEAVQWLDGILKQYPEDVAILLFHSFMDPGGYPTVPGKKLIPLLVAPNPNVRMVLSGHIPGRHTKVETFDSDGNGTMDHSVIFSMYDYTAIGARNGQLRIWTFDPVKRDVTMETYSPVTDAYYRDNGSTEIKQVFEQAF